MKREKEFSLKGTEKIKEVGMSNKEFYKGGVVPKSHWKRVSKKEVRDIKSGK